jgi:mannose-1-phosphate guanylyltransferase/mannose-6-phosphate isomerase
LDGTLFGRTLRRLDGLDGLQAPIVVTGADYLAITNDAIAESGERTSVLIAEPAGRNTAPAVLAAALVAEPSDVLVVLPSDHLVSDEDGFREAVRTAVNLAEEGRLVTFGITPDRPETGFGYIEAGEDLGDCFRLARFMEKPASDVAEQIWDDGTHLWNSGMFVFQARTVIAETEKHRPELAAAVRRALPSDRGPVVNLSPDFANVESISIDYAVMEHTSRGVVIPIDVGWADVGSYQTLLEVSDTDSAGNATSGDVSLLNVANSYVHGVSRKIVVAGLDGVVVVETPEGVLVVPVEHSQIVRDLVGLLDDAHR